MRFWLPISQLRGGGGSDYDMYPWWQGVVSGNLSSNVDRLFISGAQGTLKNNITFLLFFVFATLVTFSAKLT